MNQRAGKTHKAAASDGLGEMKLRNFFRTCADLLKENNDEDAAYYFEQIVEEINQGKPLPAERKEISRLLGI
jgi:hypothetical protein